MAPRSAAIAVKKKEAAAAANGDQKRAKQCKTAKAAQSDEPDKQPAKRRAGAKAAADSKADEVPAKQRKTATTAANEKPAKQPAKRSAGSKAEAEEKPARQRKTEAKAAGSKADKAAGGSKGGKAADGQAAEALDSMKPTGLAEHTEYFLVKDEPHDYSIEDLEKEGTAEWDGVRNYQARNIMQKMHGGNQVLFYRSGTKDPGLVGLAEVCKDPYPDHTSWDEKAKGFDSKSTPENPRWFMVDIKFKRKFDNFVSLATLKKHKDTELAGLALLRVSRLSVMGLTKEHFDFMLKLAEEAQNE